MADRPIAPTGSGPAPLALDVQASQELIPKMAFATFDGLNAAGDFIPVVRIVGPNGQVAGQATGDTVTAGASVDHTWFRGLSKKGGSAGIQFGGNPAPTYGPDNVGGYLLVQTEDKIPFSPNAGIELVDTGGGGIFIDSEHHGATIQILQHGQNGAVEIEAANPGTIFLGEGATGLTIHVGPLNFRLDWDGDLVSLNLPTAPGPTGTLWNSGGFVKVA